MKCSRESKADREGQGILGRRNAYQRALVYGRQRVTVPPQLGKLCLEILDEKGCLTIIYSSSTVTWLVLRREMAKGELQRKKNLVCPSQESGYNNLHFGPESRICIILFSYCFFGETFKIRPHPSNIVLQLEFLMEFSLQLIWAPTLLLQFSLRKTGM